jgi:hypothetical protein
MGIPVSLDQLTALPTGVAMRIKELRVVPVAEIADHPLQWREHPGIQVQTLRDMLARVGIANVVLAYRSPTRNPGMLTAIDGHMRKNDSGVDAWPTVILDVTDDEADALLATLDPISALAGANADRLRELHDRLTIDDEAVQRMLADVRARHGVVDLSSVEFKEYDESIADTVQFHECPACGHKWPA